MRVTIEPTPKIVQVADPANPSHAIPARVWQGVTDKGLQVTMLVTRVAAAASSDCRELEEALKEQTPPRADVAAFPTRMILSLVLLLMLGAGACDNTGHPLPALQTFSVETAAHHVAPYDPVGPGAPADIVLEQGVPVRLHLFGGTAAPGPAGFQFRPWVRRGGTWAVTDEIWQPAPVSVELDTLGADGIYIEVEHVDAEGLLDFGITEPRR